jgi:hypothetical protein
MMETVEIVKRDLDSPGGDHIFKLDCGATLSRA